MANGDGKERFPKVMWGHMVVTRTRAMSGAASFHERQERREMVRCSRG
jgi:hypothetical protein